MQALDEKKDKITKQQTELKETIYPTYEDIAFDVQNRMSQLETEYGDLSTAITKQGEILPQKFAPSLPKFTPGKIQGEKLGKLFGTLSSSSFTSDKHGYSLKTKQKSPEAGSSPPVKQLLDKPEIVTTIDTEYKQIYSMACVSDKEIWTKGYDSIMKLYSINQGSLLKSIRTRSGNISTDIAVTKSGDLVYIDGRDRTVDVAKNEKKEEVIKIQKHWDPIRVCSTSSGDLLIIMYRDDETKTETKVVRYSGSTEKQTIQFDDKGNPLYSFSYDYYGYIYMTENRNLDICVSDCLASAVVVVNQAGKLRFRYTGHTPAPNNSQFTPLGITTDSQGHILTADNYNNCVHIIDQDGQFLNYIQCELCGPWVLCTDTNDNLFVAQNSTSHILCAEISLNLLCSSLCREEAKIFKRLRLIENGRQQLAIGHLSDSGDLKS
ncbi:uncharacterized protein LOC134260236 [Saccostrea cucullata]|uniref:uncharacterized protein LOC134260236 n=1 Tax=Saccostrea cuccullata TaxID=36930 RepID=UPI002ED2484A